MGFAKHYYHEEMMIDNDPTDVCEFCGFIRPCECDVNERHPWPTDPASLTEAEATTLSAVRFDFRRREREAA